MSVKESFTLEKAKEIFDYALTEFYLHDKALVQYPSIKEAVSEKACARHLNLMMGLHS